MTHLPKILKRADYFLFLAMVLILVFVLSAILSINPEAFRRQLNFA